MSIEQFMWLMLCGIIYGAAFMLFTLALFGWFWAGYILFKTIRGVFYAR